MNNRLFGALSGSDLDDIVALKKMKELAEEKRKQENNCKLLVIVLAVIGAVLVVAAAAYGIYKLLNPDYLDDFDEDFDAEVEEVFNGDAECEKGDASGDEE